MDRSVMVCSDEDKKLAEQIITHVRREAARNHSYLEKGIFFLKPAVTGMIKYIGADYSCLYYNPVGVIELYSKSPAILENAIIHAVLHCMMLHPSMMPEENKLFNASADTTVNAMLENTREGHGTEAVDFLRKNKLGTVSQIYNAVTGNRYLEKRIKAIAEKNKYDDHSVWYKPPEDAEQAGAQCVMSAEEAQSTWQMLEQAAASECSMLYGSEKGNIFMALEPPDRFSKFSYDEYIRRFAVEEIMEDDPETIDMILYTMSSEMYDDVCLVEWNELSERSNPTDLVIAIDMSGSCSGEVAANFLRQVYTLFEEMNIKNNVNIHVVTFDTRIINKGIIRSKNDADEFIRNYRPEGFGGTDFHCVFDYADNFPAESGGRRLKGLFFFSDACGSFPEKKSNYPTTFFVPGDGYVDLDFVPDWVELVHYYD